MKKILLSTLLLLSLTLGSSFAVSASNSTTSSQGAVLEWSMFSRSQAGLESNGAGRALNCRLESTQAMIRLEATDKEAYEVRVAQLQSTDPGYLRDVRGCILQEKADAIIKWLVYLAIIIIIMYILWTLAMTYLGGSGNSQQGGMWMDPMWGGGWQDDTMKKLKPALIALTILFLIVLGTVNAFLQFISWLKDILIG